MEAVASSINDKYHHTNMTHIISSTKFTKGILIELKGNYLGCIYLLAHCTCQFLVKVIIKLEKNINVCDNV